MFDTIFEINIAGRKKAETGIEFFQVYLCAECNRGFPVYIINVFKGMFHQLPAKTFASCRWGNYYAADKWFRGGSVLAA